MIEKIKNYIRSNAVPLFNCETDQPLKALFTSRGFSLSNKALLKYAFIKDQPHLYVAYTDQKEGFYYIGKSFQKGGRWKQQHAYHLGTLAYHLLGTVRKDDQNHQHWIESWMNVGTVQVNIEPFSIQLKDSIYITFIPFEQYSSIELSKLDKKAIRFINSTIERQLIESYRIDGYTLLNIQNNMINLHL